LVKGLKGVGLKGGTLILWEQFGEINIPKQFLPRRAWESGKITWKPRKWEERIVLDPFQ